MDTDFTKEQKIDFDNGYARGFSEGKVAGRNEAIKELIAKVKKLEGYTDWADGGCTYDELVHRDAVIYILNKSLNKTKQHSVSHGSR